MFCVCFLYARHACFLYRHIWTCMKNCLRSYEVYKTYTRNCYEAHAWFLYNSYMCLPIRNTHKCNIYALIYDHIWHHKTHLCDNDKFDQHMYVTYMNMPDTMPYYAYIPRTCDTCDSYMSHIWIPYRVVICHTYMPRTCHAYVTHICLIYEYHTGLLYVTHLPHTCYI